uniref:Uncharacterized protein n=1 Tax=Arundo donax TaxID=35708 RepID=A0A0A9C5B4_ARUDO
MAGVGLGANGTTLRRRKSRQWLAALCAA